jgi:putative membrane protein
MPSPVIPRQYHKPVGWLILAMYTAGAVGLSLVATRSLFIALTPFHLLATTLLVLLAHNAPNLNFWLVCLLVAGLGFGVEWLGVHTGVIFGNYTYGSGLGWRWQGIPYMIGVNWLLLVYCISTVTARFKLKAISQALLGSGVLVLLDVLIEPVAPELRFWQFEGGQPQLHNFIGWYVVGVLLIALFNYFVRNVANSLSIIIVAAQFAFFALLNLKQLLNS